jgi:UDP-glucose 4-epimerase
VLTGHQPMRVRDLVEMIREIAGADIQVEFRPVDSQQRQAGRTAHYLVTPYTFQPKLAKKLVSDYYVDLGQGLLDCLEELHDTMKPAASATAAPQPASRKRRKVVRVHG